ncbi:MAG: hypothetical protein KJ042_15655, partial [Deltaproteobacteria bacterium]|nr:hypothetical protein [Deltaproteobacteria bacterium]
LYEYDGAYYEALSLAVARVALDIDQVTPRFAPVPWGAKRDYSGLEWLAIGNRSIPVDERVQTRPVAEPADEGFRIQRRGGDGAKRGLHRFPRRYRKNFGIGGQIWKPLADARVLIRHDGDSF